MLGKTAFFREKRRDKIEKMKTKRNDNLGKRLSFLLLRVFITCQTEKSQTVGSDSEVPKGRLQLSMRDFL